MGSFSMGRQLVRAAVVTIAAVVFLVSSATAWAIPSGSIGAVHTELTDGNATLEAADVTSASDSGIRLASNTAAAVPQYRWRLRTPCQLTDATTGGCVSGDFCPAIPGRLIGFYVVQRQRLAQPLVD